MTDLPDAEARHRILTDFGTTLFVEAAAGTGKTTALVCRIIALVREGLGALDRMVAVWAAAISTGSLRREVPIMHRRDDGTLAEGVVDLAFLEEGPDFTGWTVVDFKTDLEFESSRAEYSAQVALYVEAIEKATNSTARGILFVI